MDIASIRLWSRSARLHPAPGWARAWLQVWLCLLLLPLLPGMAAAQDIILLENSRGFEGNSGSRFFEVAVTFGGGVSTVRNTGRVSAQPLSGVAFNPATGGTACGSGVDFVAFSNLDFVIPAGTASGAFRFQVEVCGDLIVEPAQHVFVAITLDNNGSFCGERCVAIMTIVNDDGPPALSIQNTTVTEPLSGTRTATVTVVASHPVPVAGSVNYSTADGTARTSNACGTGPIVLLGCSDYGATSGTLPLPLGALSATLGVTIRADVVDNEPDQTFSVILSTPVNATVSRSTATVTIKDIRLFVGSFSLTQPADRVAANSTDLYSIEWTVPPHLVWRALDTIDLRVRGAQGDGSFLRWSEAANTFSVCRPGHGRHDDDDEQERAVTRMGAHCGPALLPGSQGTLSLGHQVELDLSRTRVIGSGPLGQSVMLDLALSFTKKTEGHTLTLELAAADDFGNEDRYTPAGKVNITKAPKRDSH